MILYTVYISIQRSLCSSRICILISLMASVEIDLTARVAGVASGNQPVTGHEDGTNLGTATCCQKTRAGSSQQDTARCQEQQWC